MRQSEFTAVTPANDNTMEGQGDLLQFLEPNPVPPVLEEISDFNRALRRSLSVDSMKFLLGSRTSK